ncbi:hypothetical protein MN116_006463 [Schistosoma mekongi]|uniref:Uncharacterized protein n=1 Tax=Schistosoma mekongi TaxID=38744 RepID=A0AAE1ZBV9_SCHME|nr:hypothetical protein MN116_006463 [Schistosoma mekongi]
MLNSDEAYIAYLTERQVGELYQSIQDHQCIPHSIPYFYTTGTGLECRRYYCQVCGPLARSNLKNGSVNIKHAGVLQRQLDWITGTTLPDALTRSREAMAYYNCPNY